MPKIPIIKPSLVVKVLEKAGFVFKRQKGSHCIYSKGVYVVVVPMHPRDLKKGTISNIIKQSGMSITEFIDFIK